VRRECQQREQVLLQRLEVAERGSAEKQGMMKEQLKLTTEQQKDVRVQLEARMNAFEAQSARQHEKDEQQVALRTEQLHQTEFMHAEAEERVKLKEFELEEQERKFVADMKRLQHQTSERERTLTLEFDATKAEHAQTIATLRRDFERSQHKLDATYCSQVDSFRDECSSMEQSLKQQLREVQRKEQEQEQRMWEKLEFAAQHHREAERGLEDRNSKLEWQREQDRSWYMADVAKLGTELREAQNEMTREAIAARSEASHAEKNQSQLQAERELCTTS